MASITFGCHVNCSHDLSLFIYLYIYIYKRHHRYPLCWFKEITNRKPLLLLHRSFQLSSRQAVGKGGQWSCTLQGYCQSKPFIKGAVD